MTAGFRGSARYPAGSVWHRCARCRYRYPEHKLEWLGGFGSARVCRDRDGCDRRRWLRERDKTEVGR